MKKIISLILGITLLLSMTVSAYADTIILYKDSTNTVSTIKSDVKNVELPKHKVVPLYLENIYLTNNKSVEFLTNEVTITFDSYIVGSNLGFKYTSSGTSIAFWGGDDPYKIDKITMTDSLAATGLSSFTGAGWTVNIGSGSATYTTSIDDDWYIQHDYENIEMNGLIVYLSHTLSATFKYGTKNKTVNCSDGSSA